MSTATTSKGHWRVKHTEEGLLPEEQEKLGQGTFLTEPDGYDSTVCSEEPYGPERPACSTRTWASERRRMKLIRAGRSPRYATLCKELTPCLEVAGRSGSTEKQRHAADRLSSSLHRAKSWSRQAAPSLRPLLSSLGRPVQLLPSPPPPTQLAIPVAELGHCRLSAVAIQPPGRHSACRLRSAACYAADSSESLSSKRLKELICAGLLSSARRWGTLDREESGPYCLLLLGLEGPLKRIPPYRHFSCTIYSQRSTASPSY